MSFLILLLMAMGRKINLTNRLLLKESLNQENFSSIVVLLKRIFKYTIFFEFIGMLFLATNFVPYFGWTKG